MNTTKDNNPDYKLLAKYLAGEATPEEAIEVDDWILRSENNRKLFDQVAATWQGIPADAPQQISRPASLFKIKAYQMGIAASILVLVGALWLFVRSPRKNPAHNATAAAI